MAIRNPISFWKMSSTTDELGVNTLTNTGGVTFSSGFIGNAAVFDGTNKRLSLSTSGGFSSTSTNTWAFVYKPSVITASYILDVSDSASSRRIILYCTGAGLLRVYASGVDSSTGITVSAGNWYRIVITHSSGSVVCYINNINQLSSVSGTTGNTTSYLSIGTPGDSFGANATCQIDAFGLWDVVLTTQEITELNNGGLWKEYPFSIISSSSSFFHFFQ